MKHKKGGERVKADASCDFEIKVNSWEMKSENV